MRQHALPQSCSHNWLCHPQGYAAAYNSDSVAAFFPMLHERAASHNESAYPLEANKYTQFWPWGSQVMQRPLSSGRYPQGAAMSNSSLSDNRHQCQCLVL